MLAARVFLLMVNALSLGRRASSCYYGFGSVRFDCWLASLCTVPIYLPVQCAARSHQQHQQHRWSLLTSS